ncbi:DUF2312 domain-containing protein [Pseudomonadota bacterium]
MENKVDQKLRQFVEGIERLEQEKAEITKQISEVYKDAKASGFDTKIMRKIVSLRKRDREELQEEEYLLETYKEALGMSD